MVPRPRASGLAATSTALIRLAGPSHDSSLEFLIAPVMTTGTPAGMERSRRYAVSSMVSVPCITTTPSTPPSAMASRMARRSSHIRSMVMCGPG
jgi:hypothetical protein